MSGIVVLRVLVKRDKSPMIEMFPFQSQIHSCLVSNIDQSVWVSKAHADGIITGLPAVPFGD
jgi:hypothetical protein